MQDPHYVPQPHRDDVRNSKDDAQQWNGIVVAHAEGTGERTRIVGHDLIVVRGR